MSRRIRRLTPPARPRDPAIASAFTLVEVLLALGLTVVLMVAVFAAFDLYRLYSAAGREQMERAQLARAIFQQMESDIRSVVFAPQEPASTSADEQAADETGATTEGTTSSEETTAVEFTDPAAAYTQSSIGIFGDSQTLILHVSRPRRDLNYATIIGPADLATGTSDLQSVAYFLAAPGSGGLAGMVGNLSAGGGSNFAMTTELQGLARMQGDRLAMNLADAEGNIESLAAQSRVLAPEVTFLQFRYFDGLIWTDAWDSVTLGRLPNAIEITLGFRPPEEDAVGMDSTAPIISETRRCVVAVPLADPVTALEPL
ncbi:MAG: hypothetical protein ACREJB_06740 [Planctomycetaceae bacterium]